MAINEKNNTPGVRWIRPDKKDFPDKYDKNLDSLKGINHVKISSEFNYIFFTIESGSLEPRDDYVIDKTSKQKRKNPKKETEIELLKQLFAYYDYKTNLLYLSDVRNRKHFEDIIHEITGENFLLKGIYEEKEKFLELLSNVEEIKFTTKNNIFSGNSRKRNSLKEFIGTPEIPDLTLDIKANSHSFNPVKLVNDLMKEEDDCAISGLLIRGKDESGFELVYNQETFIKKITVDAEKIAGKFNADDIKINLQSRIKEIDNDRTKQER